MGLIDKLLRRKPTKHPPLRKRGEDTPPDPDGKTKLYRGEGNQKHYNGDNQKTAARYGGGGGPF